MFLLKSHARGTAPTLIKIQNSVERSGDFQVSFFLETKGVKRSYRVICHGFEKPAGRDVRFITVWGEVVGEDDGWVARCVDPITSKSTKFFTAIIDAQSPMFDRNGPCVVWFSKRGGLFYRYRSIRKDFLNMLKQLEITEQQEVLV